jgi:leucyl aminopeptidase
MIDLFKTDSVPNATPVYFLSEGTFDNWVSDQSERTQNWIAVNEFAPKPGAVLIVPDAKGAAALAIVGLGDANEPFAPGSATKKLPAGDWGINQDLSTGTRDQLLLGLALEYYVFDRYRKDDRKTPKFCVPKSWAISEIWPVIDGSYLARDLVNTPANDMGPSDLEDAIRDLARRFDATVVSTAGDELLSQNFPLVHAVGRASVDAPRLVDLQWGNKAAPKLTLVGKGVCYDTGGLDLKPSSAMALMKKDMGGAANVMGLASMIMASNLNVRLRVLIPAVENAVAGNAFRTGDIYPSRKGLTVEIGNTDAEGRLVLADALALADEDEPDLLIDMATLTGAARVALGPDVSPFYTNDDSLAEAFARHGEIVADPVWRMPLFGPYDKWMDGKIADLSNTGDVPMAGSITAAHFLHRFVDRAKQYAHFDIYAWVSKARPGKPIGGEAHAIRALFSYLKATYD